MYEMLLPVRQLISGSIRPRFSTTTDPTCEHIIGGSRLDPTQTCQQHHRSHLQGVILSEEGL
eukprot:2551510-Pyramimonas_sp.AAC.1